MSHGFDAKRLLKGFHLPPDNPVVAVLTGVIERFNKFALYLSMVALMLTALIMTYSVVARWPLHAPGDWRDDATVFMLVRRRSSVPADLRSRIAAISASKRVHLPASVNAVRLLLVDVVSFLFCAFFREVVDAVP